MAQIEIIFPIYDDRFYRYLRPYVVDDLRKRDKMVSIFRFHNTLDKTCKNHIKVSVRNYLVYMFPRDTFPPIKVGLKQKLAEVDEESQRDVVWKQVQKYLSEHNWWDEIFENMKQDFMGCQLTDYVTEDTFPVNYMEQVDKLKEEILLRPLHEVITELKDKFKDKDLLEYNKFISLPKVSKLHLPKDLLINSYKKLRIQWEQLRRDIAYDKQPKHIRTPRAQNAKEYIDFNIIPTEKADEEKSLEQIFDLVFDKMRKNDTREELYQYYLNQRNKYFKRTSFQFSKYIPTVTVIDDNYKNLTKMKTIPNYFPLKQNLKNYGLHVLAPRYSYLIDLMFENKKSFCYLVAININTRKLWVEPTNVKIISKDDDEDDAKIQYRVIEQMKNSEVYIEALQTMIAKGMRVKYLKGDGEKAFDSEKAHKFYNACKPKIEFTPVKMRQQTEYPKYMDGLNMVKSIKSEPNHTSLGIIDRVIRTIREIAYNLHVGLITPEIMEYIVYLYNNTPHITLSKYAGKKVTPNDVDNNPDLEAFIVRKIHQENYVTTTRPGFNIRDGEEVIVYNVRNDKSKRRSTIEPYNWRIKQRVGNLYEIVDKDNPKHIKIISRYKIHPRLQPYNLFNL